MDHGKSPNISIQPQRSEKIIKHWQQLYADFQWKILYKNGLKGYNAITNNYDYMNNVQGKVGTKVGVEKGGC